MILIMTASCRDSELTSVVNEAQRLGLEHEISTNGSRSLVILSGPEKQLDPGAFLSMPCVEKAIPLSGQDGLVSNKNQTEQTVIKIGETLIGGGNLGVIAGPCALESLEQALTVAKKVQKAGAGIFRGGAYKPRTSPYSFQGLGDEGLKILAKVREDTGMSVVTEVLDIRSLNQVYKYADIIQIGSRSMHNTPLLKEVGGQDKPVILKRGMAATVKEWLLAAEYILSHGNGQVILCERGVRTFSDYGRFTLDLGVIPTVKENTHLPIIVDPSHGTGMRTHVPPMSLAAIAAGADGLMIEVHDKPDESISDGPQSIDPLSFEQLMKDIKRLALTLDKII